MNDVIRAGEEMRQLRAEMVKVFIGFGWTQERIARLTGMSQPAVSKQVAKYRSTDPGPPLDLALGQGDAAWLEGRLWALAEDISETYEDAARCTSYVSALARGRKRFTPENVDGLRRLVEEDLRRNAGEPAGSGGEPLRAHRRAYDEISRGLDLPSGTAATPAGPASARRALAHRIQRDRLRGSA
ncbi:sigma-70 family RNA polymerase sigma factor [Streptomyces sp. 840.1]|uniref:sigma-70 family RNA polymerase sigma factor n=1 Tax=Streptomyces sp. 840.1 TaxID=2485152 RepID=UPI0021A3C74B|nr:sigma-70 family RNA polymerase sigma factor [Streptomyces sp. 840.1]